MTTDRNSQFVFSPRTDVLVFGLPIWVAALFAAVVPSDVMTNPPLIWTTALYSATVGLLIDHGHIYGTIIPVFLDRSRRRLLSWRAFAIPLGVFAVGMSLVLYSPTLFMYILAYLAFFHVARQQYGWLTVLERKEAANRFVRWDRFFFISSILAPFYFWQSGQSAVLTRYFYDGDMPLRYPQNLWPFVGAIHGLIALAFVWSVIRRHLSGQPILEGKLFFLLTNWIWFFGGLVLSPRASFFWMTLILCHGLSYHVHVNSYSKTSFGGSMPWWISRKAVFLAPYFLFIVGAGFLNFWMVSRYLQYRAGVFIVNYCLICHYMYDAVVWRRSYRPPSTQGLVVQAVSEPEIEDQIHGAAVIAYD